MHAIYQFIPGFTRTNQSYLFEQIHSEIRFQSKFLLKIFEYLNCWPFLFQAIVIICEIISQPLYQDSVINFVVEPAQNFKLKMKFELGIDLKNKVKEQKETWLRSLKSMKIHLKIPVF